MSNPTLVLTIKPFGSRKGDPTVGHDKYEENLDKAKHNGIPCSQTDCCCYCGRKAIGGKTFAFLTNIGQFAVAEDYEDNPGNDHLGLYPVGSECAKLLKSHGVVIYDQDCKRVR